MFEIPTIQFIDHMKLKKKEDQSAYASVFLKRGNKILMEGRELEGFGMKRGGGKGRKIRYGSLK